MSPPQESFLSLSLAGPSVDLNGPGTGPGNNNGSSENGSVVHLAYTGIGINGNYTGVTIQSAGSDGAHNTMMPFVALGYIIKY